MAAPRLPRRVVLPALVVGSAACAPDASGSGDAAVTVRDSAGVTIVENGAPVLDDAAAWRLSQEPTLQIGAVDESDEAFVRVTAARTLSDGRIAVFDVGRRQLRLFGPDGAFLLAVGREGEGPGEFQGGGGLDVLPGDTLLVFDLLQRRITLFDAAGELVTTVQPRSTEDGGSTYLDRLSDGSYLLQGGTNAMYLGEGSGLLRGEGWIVRVDAEGGTLGRITGFRTGEGIVFAGGAGWMSIPYARRHFTAAAPGGLVLGFADRFRFEIHDLEGALRRIVRRTGEPMPVTAADRDEYLDRVRTSGSSLRQEHIEQIEFPDSYPAYDELTVDLAGHVWVREYRRSGAEGPRRWSVFDAEGRWITVVAVPDDLYLMEIGDGHVLAVWYDELDVGYLRRYELLKG